MNELWHLLELYWTRDPSSRPTVHHVVGCLEGAARNWKADATAFLIASAAGVQEVMNMEREKAQTLGIRAQIPTGHIVNTLRGQATCDSNMPSD